METPHSVSAQLSALQSRFDQALKKVNESQRRIDQSSGVLLAKVAARKADVKPVITDELEIVDDEKSDESDEFSTQLQRVLDTLHKYQPSTLSKTGSIDSPITKTNDDSHQKLEDAHLKIAALIKDVARLKRVHKRAEQKVLEEGKKVRMEREKQRELQEKVEDQNQQLHSLKNKIILLKRELKCAKGMPVQVQSDHGEINELKDENQSLRKEMAKEKGNREKQTTLVRELRARVAELENDNRTLTQDFAQKIQRLQNENRKRKGLEKSEGAKRERVLFYKHKCEEYERENQRLSKENKTLGVNKKDVSLQMRRFNRSLDKLTVQNKEDERTIQEQRESIQKLKNEIKQLKHTTKQLRIQRDHYRRTQEKPAPKPAPTEQPLLDASLRQIQALQELCKQKDAVLEHVRKAAAELGVSIQLPKKI